MFARVLLPLLLLSASTDPASAACEFRGGTDEKLFSDLFTCVWNTYAARYPFVRSGRNANLQSRARSYPLPGYLLRWTIDINDVRRHGPSNLLLSLISDYEPERARDEPLSSSTRAKEVAMLNHVFNSSLVDDVYTTLRMNGVLGRVGVSTVTQFRQFVDEVWFARYSGTSGFKHVFAGEIDRRDNVAKGLHSWMQILNLENQNDFDYYGYYDRVNAINIGSIKYGRRGFVKTISSIFFGTPVEFELMLYTACFISKKDRDCEVNIDGNQIIVRTFSVTWKPDSIATAYPILDENTLMDT